MCYFNGISCMEYISFDLLVCLFVFCSFVLIFRFLCAQHSDTSALICYWFHWHAEKNWMICVRWILISQKGQSIERLKHLLKTNACCDRFFFHYFWYQCANNGLRLSKKSRIFAYAIPFQVWKSFKSITTPNDKTKSMPYDVGLVQHICLPK